MKNKEKNKSIRKLLAGFYRGKNKFEADSEERQLLKRLKKNLFYRNRITPKHELIKGRNKKHMEQIRKQEEALGIRVLV